MITTLEDRRIKLIIQIEKLKKEVDILKWTENKELALCCCTGSVKYLIIDRPHESPRN